MDLPFLVWHGQSWNAYKHLQKLANDVHVGDAPSIKKFMEMEETLMNENDDVITSLGLWSWMKAN